MTDSVTVKIYRKPSMPYSPGPRGVRRGSAKRQIFG
jgi:hypothetical protein